MDVTGSSAPRSDRPARPSAPAGSLAVHHLFDLGIEFARMDIVPTALGTRMVAVIRAGTFEGPALRGTVQSGGGDWIVVGSDGIARLDIRATLRTNGDDLVYMTASGRIRLTAEARERFLAGDPVSDPEMVGRATPLFETGASLPEPLNALVTIAVVHELALDHIDYRIYALE